MIEAALALLTAPFPIFLIVLTVSAVTWTSHVERRDP